MANSSTSRSALNLLSELKLQRKKEQYPDLPYPAKTTYSDSTANGLTKAIVDYINLSGGMATRISSEGRWLPEKGIRIPSNTKRGTADIHASWKGKHLSIEVKIGKDKQSDAQIEMQRKVEASGGLYFIAKSFDSFYNWINSL